MADVLGDFLSRIGQMQDIKTSQQQQTLRKYEIERQERAAQPGSLENLTRQAETEKQKSYLQDIELITQAATNERQIKAQQAEDDAIVQRIDSGEDGKAVIREYHPNAEYVPIEVAPGVTRPGFRLPGDDNPQFISDTDRDKYISYMQAKNLAAVKSKTKPATRKRPDDTTIKNIMNIALADTDELMQKLIDDDDTDSTNLNAFATLVANEAQKLMDDNPALSFDDASNIAYDTVKAAHIDPGKNTGWFDFEFDRPAGISRKPILKSNEVRRQTKDGRFAIFDANSKKFLRYE